MLIKRKLKMLLFISVSYFLMGSALASHHIDCSDPIFSIFPECSSGSTSGTPEVVPEPIKTDTASCISVFNTETNQLSFDWVDFVKENGNVDSAHKNVVLDLVETNPNYVFSLNNIDLTSSISDSKPEDLNCHNLYNIAAKILSIPALKIGSSNPASYQNILMSFDSLTGQLTVTNLEKK